ncbi:MAG: GTP-binding protein [Bacteroidetes bacterium]|nr:GTP-binding protein [Bacteroidota bacterium]
MDTFLDERIPVTILTGFLGSGKTTLLNRILTEQHGKKIAVIENEFGEVGVDNELVIDADEEIFEMNNGCICCTVRGDLIRILGNLMKRKDRLDMIMIETTGLADPGPVAQTFFVDDEMQSKYKIDAIITLVDAKHVLQHIDDSDECKRQIAFADVIVLNKIDLVPTLTLNNLEKRLRSMNSLASIHRVKDANLDLKYVLDINAFDLDKKVELNPVFLQEELPFEYGGIYSFTKEQHTITFGSGPDPSITIAFIKLPSSSYESFEAAKKRAILVFSDYAQVHEPMTFFTTHKELHQFNVEKSINQFTFQPHDEGYYAVFTQHGPEEFDMCIQYNGMNISSIENYTYAHSHSHDDEVSSVGIENEKEVDLKKFKVWINFMLQTKGMDIFRSKGILNINGSDTRLVFQAVHMLLDASEDRHWRSSEKRRNQLVFIGRNLNRLEITEGFEACLVN